VSAVCDGVERPALRAVDADFLRRRIALHRNAVKAVVSVRAVLADRAGMVGMIAKDTQATHAGTDAQ
jgi:hypothetical protein